MKIARIKTPTPTITKNHCISFQFFNSATLPSKLATSAKRNKCEAQQLTIKTAGIKAPTPTTTTTKKKKNCIDSRSSAKAVRIQLLPIDFEPGPFDVICCHGNKAKVHIGNAYFQDVVDKRAAEYASASGRGQKSKIVSEIVQNIQSKSPNAGFVKKMADGVTKAQIRWMVVCVEQARVKVSQSLRDALADHYRSSLRAKRRSRQESNVKKVIDFEKIVASNRFVSSTIKLLSNTIQKHNNNDDTDLSELQLMELMTATNLDILRQLKQDQTVQSSVRIQPQQELQHTEEETEESDCHIERCSFSCHSVDENLKRFETDKKYFMTQMRAKKRRRLSFEEMICQVHEPNGY